MRFAARRRAAAVVLLPGALALLSACEGWPGAGGGHPCTLIGSASGISLRVAPELAGRVAEARATVCWHGGTCRERSLVLREASRGAPSSPGDPVMTTGSPTAPRPETTTRAPSPAPTAPTAAVPGFVDVRGLPEKPVRVTLTFKDEQGGALLDRHITVTPKRTYPNGRDCSPGGPQAGVDVAADGSLSAR